MKNYENLREFIEAVEEAPTWDSIEVEKYQEALEEVGLDYGEYDDPDIMWEDFIKAYKKANKIDIFEEATGQWSSTEEFSIEFLDGIHDIEKIENVYLRRNGNDSRLRVEYKDGKEETYVSRNGGRWFL